MLNSREGPTGKGKGGGEETAVFRQGDGVGGFDPKQRAERKLARQRVKILRSGGELASLRYGSFPKRHIDSLNALSPQDDALVGELIRRAAAIARDKGFAERGFRTVFNTNGEAGQTVFHIHLHLLAGRGLTWPPG